MKNYYCKRKNLLNHFVNRVEELEILVLINKLDILKKYKASTQRVIFDFFKIYKKVKSKHIKNLNFFEIYKEKARTFFQFFLNCLVV